MDLKLWKLEDLPDGVVPPGRYRSVSLDWNLNTPAAAVSLSASDCVSCAIIKESIEAVERVCLEEVMEGSAHICVQNGYADGPMWMRYGTSTGLRTIEIYTSPGMFLNSFIFQGVI
jgi:hypothetical protein